MPVDTALPAPRAARRLSAERLVFLILAASLLLAVFVGFAPTYYLRGVAPPPPRPMPQLTLLLHVHGALFSAWIVLFMVQTGLVAAGRRRLHMALGSIGLPMVLAMVGVGAFTGLIQAARGPAAPGFDPLMFLSLPAFSLLGMAILFPAALLLRRAPAAHKRLMVLGMTAMISAAFARMSFLPFMFALLAAPSLYILALAAWDLVSLRRLHPATLWGGLVALVAIAGPVLVMRTPAWLGFARWAVGLVA